MFLSEIIGWRFFQAISWNIWRSKLSVTALSSFCVHLKTRCHTGLGSVKTINCQQKDTCLGVFGMCRHSCLSPCTICFTSISRWPWKCCLLHCTLSVWNVTQITKCLYLPLWNHAYPINYLLPYWISRLPGGTVGLNRFSWQILQYKFDVQVT